MGDLDLRNAGTDTVGTVKELTEAEKAQIKMTYCVLGGIAGLFILSGAAYILTDNGVAEYLADMKNICAVDVSGHNHITEFCSKYIAEAKSEVNTAAKEIFEFSKNFLPPIVTLVLGAHYVTRTSE